ncbi:thioredoxin fold domain-containing protein, partial [Myxococcota bacterium]|nr:thioredoxin fold domain-containing protein [Myxococcota bacterium]
ACKELEHKTYTDPEVRVEATRFVSLKIDATQMTDPIKELFERYGVQGLPAVVFVNSEGQVMEDPRVTGFMPPARFLDVLSRVH